MTSYETIQLSVEAGAARITLNRPDSLNAWTEQLGHELGDAVDAAATDDAVRAVLITGAGRAFSSGADLRDHGPGDGGAPDLGVRLREIYNPTILRVREMPKPVLASVNGPAAGIGCALALACDLIIAAESAYFLLAFVNIGLVPDGGATTTVAARVGHSRAAEMALLGERIDASAALDWGLINCTAPDDELSAQTDALLAKLATGPTKAYAATKSLLNRTVYADLASQLDAEADAQREQGTTADFIEGVIAFSQKRPPNFSGG